MKSLKDKLKPPLKDRKKGDRAAKGLVPPFHDGRDIKSYRSDGSKPEGKK